ncbi:exo-beta-N-acetylmuramidase NamZ domain-containing protein [Acidobacteriota bacterium]
MKKVNLGADIFLKKHLERVKSKKVGLITNQSGIDRHGRSLVDLFAQNPEIDLVALYGPEHGVRGDAQAGEFVPFCMDDRYNLPVTSLYGQLHKPESDMHENLDELMRSFDTQKSGKALEQEMIKDIDVMVYDIQDVGTRIYTYIATMAYCMETCAENNVAFIVLDRPNPINGTNMEGPVLEYPKFSSFVGLYPIPVRHGMTTGELAELFNEKYLKRKVNLTVVPMEGWERDMWFDDTALPWIAPSPNMPSLETATVYPGQVYLEGTNISEGRGTARPFEIFGAPWIDGSALVQKLNSLRLPGVRFKERPYTPTFSKYRGELCGGAQIQVMDRKEYKPFETSLFTIKAVLDAYLHTFKFHDGYFDKIMGTSRIREELLLGLSVETILKPSNSDLAQFADTRQPFLLY